MEYFDNKSIDEEERRNTALQIVSTLREAINISQREQNPITYEKTLDILSEVKPSFYEPIIKLLRNKNESDLVKYYKELAEAQSVEKNRVTPVDLINEELHKIETVAEKNNDKKFIKKRVFDLKAAKDYFMPRKVSEHKALNQDFFLADRGDFFSRKIYEDDSHKDWISIDELEAFYKQKNIASLTNSIRVHAQEVIILTEEKNNQFKYKCSCQTKYLSFCKVAGWQHIAV